jgi:cell division protein FtsI/penicillin-binding protein 2
MKLIKCSKILKSDIFLYFIVPVALLLIISPIVPMVRGKTVHANALVDVSPSKHVNLLTKDRISEFLSGSVGRGEYPSELHLNAALQLNDGVDSRAVSAVTLVTSSRLGPFYRDSNESPQKRSIAEAPSAIVQYSFDPLLQHEMGELFKSYKPDYGAFVAMDASTGRVLSMVSYTANGNVPQNLATRASFPSASVFKVVTAAAAIEQKNFSPESVISYNGRNHTLYKSNIFKDHLNRWTRYITLKEAFARSINTVFAKIGAFTVGPFNMRNYAERFGFDRKILADFPVEEGHASLPDDQWGLAEASSGYTVENTMSPLQGALIAAAVANDGVMMQPYLVESIFDGQGEQIYSADPQVEEVSVDSKTAAEIRVLMKETVAHGTSSKSFRGFFKHGFAELEVGGKTGSLTGTLPPGKYDWFIGFARNGKRKIAVAALTIHEKLWRVKSSFLARKAFESYFSPILHGKNVASNLKK